MKTYSRNFYAHQRERSRSSAREIVPLVIDLVRPKSIVDIGCGTGAWLSVFREYSVDDICGLDGEWVDKDMLLIPAERFSQVDLKKPFHLDRQFDLVMSMEVAEHLPSDYAAGFVDSLAGLGPIILFSAAIPGQGGTLHINEQWPDYWVRLFEKRGFAVIDCIRKKVWRNENVEWWYAQNILLFVRKDQLDRYPLLRKELDDTVTAQLSLVHPQQYLAVRDPKNMELRLVLSALPALLLNAFKNVLRSWFGRARNLGE